jgi:hypothetical protein
MLSHTHMRICTLNKLVVHQHSHATEHLPGPTHIRLWARKVTKDNADYFLRKFVETHDPLNSENVNVTTRNRTHAAISHERPKKKTQEKRVSKNHENWKLCKRTIKVLKKTHCITCTPMRSNL